MKLRELSDEAKRCQTACGAAMLLAVVRWLAGGWTSDEALAELADRLCGPQWTPVDGGPPQDEAFEMDDVLVLITYRTHAFGDLDVVTAYHDGDQWRALEGQTLHGADVLAWMPIPAPYKPSGTASPTTDAED